DGVAPGLNARYPRTSLEKYEMEANKRVIQLDHHKVIGSERLQFGFMLPIDRQHLLVCRSRAVGAGSCRGKD
ncbi:MAG: hypothetical protein O6758_06360, partial [Planctomycetota bacterium]|nr:hypothetical protein [Planctomycetota bacterium]